MKSALLALLLFASTAHARTWQIDVIQAHGPREISRQDAINMATFARARFAEIGIKTRLGRVSFTKLQNPSYGLTNYTQGVFWWQRQLPPRANIVRHVLTPPFFTNGLWYIAGASTGICLLHWKYAVTTSNAQLTNIAGVSRWHQSAVAMTHELGHAFGARHTRGHSIMNIGALGFEDVATLTFAPESVRQIYQCMG